MITTIIPIEPRNRPPRAGSARATAGFTLVEILMAVSISGIVMIAVMSAFLMLGRSGMNAVHYSLAEKEVRRGIEVFSRDIRMARAITWTSATSITLTVPDNYSATSNQVTYAWDSSSSGPTAKSFYRKPGNAASTNPPTVYVQNISNFSFSRFNRLNTKAETNSETKRIQITMNVRRTSNTLVAANTTLVSASYIMRNKAAN